MPRAQHSQKTAPRRSLAGVSSNPRKFPNNAGRFDDTFGPEHATGSDAIYVIGPGVTHVSVNSDGEYPNWAIGFDASRSSVIYGASETVQPASIRALALIRAY